MPEVLSETLLKINPRMNLLGPHYVTNIVEAVQSISEGKQYLQIGKRKESKLGLPRKPQSPVIAKIQIAQGCLNNCAYCITKHAMGNLYSYSSSAIVDEITNKLKQGFKEFWLTAQDTGAYGFDSDSSLAVLLDRIVRIPSDFRIRVGMMNPRSFERIHIPLNQIYANPKIYKFIHVPIQAGNDTILQTMNRNYKIIEILPILTRFRKQYPDLSLSIDIIVGFPTETDNAFEDTIAVVKEMQPDIVNISKYGARPNTTAAKMKPLPTNVVKRRSILLSKICDGIARDRNKALVNSSPVQRVLTVALGKTGGVIARTKNYKPVILNETCELGAFYNVQLVDASKNHLKGIIIKD